MIGHKTTNTSDKFCDKPLFYWALHGNAVLQVLLVLMVVLVVIARVIPLEMQKRIINESIALREYHNLFLYCSIYLLAILCSNGLKFAINILQTFIGERAMSVMRKSLYHQIITLPLSFFRKTQPGFVVSSLMAELSTIGVFAGMAVAVPLTNILTLAAFAGYLLWLNTKLALATLSIYPIVIFILPALQKKANASNKQRIDITRKASSKIAESISGINEIHAHGSFQEEDSKFRLLVNQLKIIRIRWTLLRHGIKTTNNFFVSLGPFIVFVLGGYLVLEGELALGGMVAFLSAQEKLYDPWKELIDFYQLYQDAVVRYKKTTDHFNTPSEVDLVIPESGCPRLEGALEVAGLSYRTNDGHLLLSNISFSLNKGEHLALVGFSGSGKSTLAKCIGNLYSYSEGSIKIDRYEIKSLTKPEVTNNIGFVSQSPFIFTGTIQDNLTYAYDAQYPPDNRPESSLDDKIEALQNAGFFVDVLRFGLDSVLTQENAGMKEKVIRMRKCFIENYREKLAPVIDFFEEAKYDPELTLLENILFGSQNLAPLQFSPTSIPRKIITILKSTGLFHQLVILGYSLNKGQSGKDAQPQALSRNKTIQIEKILNHDVKNITSLDASQKMFLVEIALKYCPGKGKSEVVSPEIQGKILLCRKRIANIYRGDAAAKTAIYSPEEYITDEPIINNILFGRITSSKPNDQEKINKAVVQLLIQEDCLEAVTHLGLLYNVGSEGIRLSGGQRQKLSIARVILKKPNFLILDEATSALDNASQMRIERLRMTKWQGQCTVIAVVHRLDVIHTYDKIAVMKSGRVVEFGSYKDLIARQGFFKQLILENKNS